MRVLFTTAPLQGHFFPLVPLAWTCRSLGHEVLVVVAEQFAPTAAHSGLPVTAAGPGLDLRELADPDSVYGIADARYAHGEAFARMAAGSLPATRAIVDAWRPDVVVSERAELAGPIAAAAGGIPYAELRWGVAELPEYRAAAVEILWVPLRRLGLSGLPKPDAVISPWPPSLRLPHAAGHLGLRRVDYDGPGIVPEWLFRSGERQRGPVGAPRVCVTLGTVLPRMAPHGPAELVLGMLNALSGLGVELVVAVDDELAARLSPLPAAVRHAGRLPLSVVAGTCAAVVHHGGQGTSLTALSAGVPQVVLPGFDDQFENADAVVRSGAGLSVPLADATAPEVAKHCRRAIDDSRYAEAAAAVADEMRAQPSPSAIARLLERLARDRNVGDVRADPPDEDVSGRHRPVWRRSV